MAGKLAGELSVDANVVLGCCYACQYDQSVCRRSSTDMHEFQASYKAAAVKTVGRAATVSIRHTELPDRHNGCLLTDGESFCRFLMTGHQLAGTTSCRFFVGPGLLRRASAKHAADQDGSANVSKNPGCLRYHVTHPCADSNVNSLNST